MNHDLFAVYALERPWQVKTALAENVSQARVSADQRLFNSGVALSRTDSQAIK